MTRIEDTFGRLRARGETGIVAYVTVGFPDVNATLDLVPAIVAAGVDMVELGVPFSDPLADGVTIQRASQVALEQGVTLRACIDTCRRLREKIPLVPLIFMGYYNPILAYGVEQFAHDAAEAGADGVIVPDLPPEESEPLQVACKKQLIDLIFLLAPTSTERRIVAVAAMASGFIYCVSLTGITGARSEMPKELPNFLERVRRHTALPLAVGFGVSTTEHVRTIGRQADAVIVGSALITVIDGEEKGRLERVQSFVQTLAIGARARRLGAGGSASE